MAQDELVDVVDSEGNFLEAVSKQEAHKKGLLHKTVIGALIDSKNRWLMVRPSKGRQDAGQYVAPVGGHVASGEEEINALRREASEEIGLTGNFESEYIGRKIFNRYIIGRQENHFFILYKIFSDEKPVLNHEDEDYKYFTEEELKRELKENPTMFGDAFIFIANEFFPNLILSSPDN